MKIWTFKTLEHWNIEQAVKVAGGGKEDLLLPALYFKLYFKLLSTVCCYYSKEIVVVDIFGTDPISQYFSKLDNIWNGTSVRQAGRLSGWQNISSIFQTYFSHFIRKKDYLYFYFQNEKDQILTTNIWLNLVSIILSLPRILSLG